MSLRDRLDAFPTHRWLARLVIPIFAAQRITKIIDAATFDTILLVYLWWLSEVTAHESWLARREVEHSDD